MHAGRVGLVYQHRLKDRINPQEEGEVIRLRESVLSPGHGEQIRDIDKSLSRQDRSEVMECNSMSLEIQ